nr:hypothetical protein [Pseudarthrobacter sp. C4D7]
MAVIPCFTETGGYRGASGQDNPGQQLRVQARPDVVEGGNSVADFNG